MKVHHSALKHGIDPADSIHAAEHPLYLLDLGEDPQRQLRLGFDTSGRILEVVVLTGDDGEELLVHAMKARREYVELL